MSHVIPPPQNKRNASPTLEYLYNFSGCYYSFEKSSSIVPVCIHICAVENQQRRKFVGLCLDLAAAQTAKALLQSTAHTLSGSVAPSNTRSVVPYRLERNAFGSIGVIEAHVSAVGRSGGHFDTTVTVVLVVFEGFLDGVGWLALAFEVAGEIFYSRPASVVTTGLALQVCAFLVVKDPAEAVWDARRQISNTLQWPMLRDCVNDVLPWCGPQCLLIRVLHSGDWAMSDVYVSGEIGSIVRTFMVVAVSAFVEAVDDVGALEVLLSEMMGTMCGLGVLADAVKRSVRHVSWIAFAQRAATS